MGERAVCPVCMRETALSPRGYFHRHGPEASPCVASGSTYREAEQQAAIAKRKRDGMPRRPRPTILAFHGETGEASIRATLDDDEFGAYESDAYEEPPWHTCPAPTPEAP